MLNSLVISCATAAITLFVATTTAFANQPAEDQGWAAGDEPGRCSPISSLPLFLGMPCTRHGSVRPVEHDWALVLAMVTLASP